MTESEFTRKICKQLHDECGCLVFVAAGNKFGTAGWPDRHIITLTGEIYWLEFKSVKRETTPLQWNTIRSINHRRKGTAFVVRMPGRIEDKDGNLLSEFDGTGKDLLCQLLLLV